MHPCSGRGNNIKERIRSMQDKALDSVGDVPDHTILLGQADYSGWKTKYNYHWPQHVYANPGFQRIYIERHFVERASSTWNALREIAEWFPWFLDHILRASTNFPDTSDPSSSASLRIVSAGGGPGSDLCGANLFFKDWLPGWRCAGEPADGRGTAKSTGTELAHDITCVSTDIVEAWEDCVFGLGYEFQYASFMDFDEFLPIVRDASLLVVSHVLLDYGDAKNVKKLQRWLEKTCMREMHRSGALIIVLDRFLTAALKNVSGDFENVVVSDNVAAFFRGETVEEQVDEINLISGVASLHILTERNEEDSSEDEYENDYPDLEGESKDEEDTSRSETDEPVDEDDGFGIEDDEFEKELCRMFV
ncbi:hypothetical protein BC936DRAFT_146768 [Jimgerdemannia flammicorona]|uniref:Uncharacterized protein n=1 Tax=Jimgerdemannia flammicorona TaxID=994334 RepID=A0A433D6X5_9FUNG|nr:hypothetical protein BC936DRAFT_146768 [Jimgerdemannia flammicorona]